MHQRRSVPNLHRAVRRGAAQALAVPLGSMRLYPPAYAIAREAIDECEIHGYRIPAGTTLFMLQWVLHRDPRYFDNPEEFSPERWADGLAQRLPRFAYFPFGGGPRLCVGSSFAMMEGILVLATIAQESRKVPGIDRESRESKHHKNRHAYRLL